MSPKALAVESPATTTLSGVAAVGTRTGGSVVVVTAVSGAGFLVSGNSKSAFFCSTPSCCAAQS
ncbi:unannotated protein [freshwater metagenome]|uniref:Unannotated protein n=1 Tax=freshwater metagenome TaxID=449393 RepID=A0A6J7A5Y1_9ZZZZ